MYAKIKLSQISSKGIHFSYDHPKSINKILTINRIIIYRYLPFVICIFIYMHLTIHITFFSRYAKLYMIIIICSSSFKILIRNIRICRISDSTFFT